MSFPVLAMRSRTKSLIGVLAFAFVLRAVAAVALQHQLDTRWNRPFLIAGDAEGYWLLAERIAEGESYNIYTPPRSVLRMPGFPAFLALNMSLSGGRMLCMRLSLCVVGTVAVGLVYWLGRELAGHTTGLIASLLATVSPVMIGFTPLILSETLFAACLVGSLIAMARLARNECTHDVGSASGVGRQSWVWAVLTGALVALACYVRPSWLLAAPLFAVLLVTLSPHRLRAAGYGGLVLLTLFVVLLPWGLRNQRVTGHFVLTTLWVGPSLYDGLGPQATGDSDMTFFDRDNLLAGMTEYEVDREYRRRAGSFVRENPGRSLQLAGVKLVRFWNPVPNAPQFDDWRIKLTVGGFFLPMALLSLAGAFLVARGRFVLLSPAGREDPSEDTRLAARRLWFLILTAGPILYFTALHMVFVSSLRYRLPAEYPLLVLAAVGLAGCWKCCRGRACASRAGFTDG